MKDNIIRGEIEVINNKVGVMRQKDVDYISLTDLARYSNAENPANVIIHWMSNKATFDYLGLWEQLNNADFNFTGFREIKIKEVGYPSFTMSPRRWVLATNAMGIISKGGRYGSGTYAHPDIAFEFASWLSPEFKLYLIKEFERLKANEAYQNKIEWQANRTLAKASYTIHTDAIKENIIPTLSDKQKHFVYADEADMINVAVFGVTAKEWRDQNPDLAKKGNMRDFADLLQLIILNFIEVLNAEYIRDGILQPERLEKLNAAARRHAEIFTRNKDLVAIQAIENQKVKNLKQRN